jgi:MoaA/NifB/PqqE/SkfB family radical SAM enzyme
LNPNHKTPLTITAKIWNFCQLSCNYCASGSNAERWKPNRQPGPKELLNVDRLIQWVHCFTPGAVLHISGGEPLLWDDIESALEKIVKADIQATVTTNGLLIAKRPRLLELPLKWLVTHHRGVDFEKWHKNAVLIREKPHLVCRLALEPENKAPKVAEKYSAFNFAFGCINGLRVLDWQPRPLDFNCVASATIHLIEPDGRVFPCNNAKTNQIGDIHGMWYDRELARSRDRQARACVRGGCCAAYQSAVITDCALCCPGVGNAAIDRLHEP